MCDFLSIRPMKMKILFIIPLLAILAVMPAKAQQAALKTNLIYDALLSPNVGIEISMSPKWTLDVSGNINFWQVDGHKWRHWMVQPEARYWLCRSFAGHFFGFHALGGQYNFGNLNIPVKFLGSDFHDLRDKRYQGWGVGAGIAYGYDWIISKHWNIEAEIGLGWVFTKFDSFPCAECGSKIDQGRTHNYFGPTKVAVSLVYLF